MSFNSHSLWIRMVGMTAGLVFLVGSVIGAGVVFMIYQVEKNHMLIEDIITTNHLTLYWILGLTILSLAVGVFVTLPFFRRIYVPIDHLDKAMNQVAAGNFGVIQPNHAEKLAVVGELAAATAHEIRNPLTVVKGYTQLLSTKLEGTEYREHIQIMLSEIGRIERIIKDFMLLDKPPQIWDAININYLVNEVWRLVNYQEGIVRPEFILDEDELLVRGDPSQLKQVFLNLVNNALQAMNEGGTLTFMTWKEAQNIFVSIRDTGMGIPPKYLEKIGQPFFTTKEDGTGLGLMVSYRIVQYHGGSISVESKVAQGTVFTLSFPMF